MMAEQAASFTLIQNASLQMKGAEHTAHDAADDQIHEPLDEPA